MLGGMRALPRRRLDAREAMVRASRRLLAPGKPEAWLQHVFTHFSLELHLQLYSGGDWDSLAADEGEWWPVERIGEAGLPTLFAKAARLAVAGREEE